MSIATLFNYGEGQPAPGAKPEAVGKYDHLPLEEACKAMGSDPDATADDAVDLYERILAENRRYQNQHYKPVKFE